LLSKPFSNSLEISSKEKTISKLQVFNQRGQLVRDLEHSSPNTWRWDGRDSQGNLCATGIYLIRSAELRSFQKVLLLR
jgi:flagellar hook assembly protein FlgD